MLIITTAALLIAVAAVFVAPRLHRQLKKALAAAPPSAPPVVPVTVKRTQEILADRYCGNPQVSARVVTASPLARASLRTHAGSQEDR